jgi:hypothetical protein
VELKKIKRESALLIKLNTMLARCAMRNRAKLRASDYNLRLR